MPMTGLERKIELMRRERTLTSIAQELDVTVTQVSRVVAGERRSPRVEQAVADAIGRPIEQVFDSVPSEQTAA